MIEPIFSKGKAVKLKATQVLKMLHLMPVLLVTTVHAVGYEPIVDPASADPAWVAGQQALERGEYRKAMRHFGELAAREPGSADALNLLAYSTRKAGDAAAAIPIYEKALTLDPMHLRAHSYLGEAWLQMGDRQRAEAQLQRLVALCPTGCHEREVLQRALNASSAPTRVDQKR